MRNCAGVACSSDLDLHAWRATSVRPTYSSPPLFHFTSVPFCCGVSWKRRARAARFSIGLLVWKNTHAVCTKQSVAHARDCIHPESAYTLPRVRCPLFTLPHLRPIIYTYIAGHTVDVTRVNVPVIDSAQYCDIFSSLLRLLLLIFPLLLALLLFS